MSRMSRYIQREAVKQFSMIPMCLDDMITSDNPVRAIGTIVEHMNIETLGFTHSDIKSTGRNPYDPEDMFKLFAYSYYNGIRSSRKMEQECHRNIELMWLIGKLAPDFKTIANFRKDNKEAVQKAFYRFGGICGELGLISKEMVAIDGSKFRANNARGSWFNKKKITKQLEYYHSSADKYLQLLASCDENEDKCGRNTLPAKDLNEKVTYINSQIEKLEALGDTVQKEGEVSTNDSDSKIMKMNNGGCGVCHNVQIAVDAKSHIVVALDVTNQAGDKEQLFHIAELAKDKLKVASLTVLADKGYYTASEFAKCKDIDVVPIVSKAKNEKSAPNKNYSKINFIYDQEQDCYICPQGHLLPHKARRLTSKTPGSRYSNPKVCKACPVKTLCTTNKYRCIFDQPFQRYADEVDATTKANISLYKKRQEIVEHPFGTVKRGLGFTHFLTVGTENVRTESMLHFLAYNLKRAINMVGVQKILGVL